MSIEAIILAGGLGTRLRSVVSDRPKALASIGQKAFLDHLLESLEKTQLISRVVLALGHAADQISAYYQNKKFTFPLEYSVEISPLGTGGATRLALEKIKEEEVLILNGDSFVEFDLKIFLDFHRSKSCVGSVLLSEVKERSSFGSVLLDAKGQILSFEEKGKQGPGLINAGVYLLKKSALMNWPVGEVLSIEKDILPALILQNPGLFGFATHTRFIDIGTPTSYQAAQDFFKAPVD